MELSGREFVKWYKALLLKYRIPVFQKMQEAEDKLRTGVSVEMATELARMTLDQMEPIEGGRAIPAPEEKTDEQEDQPEKD